MAAPEALQADRSLLSAVRYGPFNAARGLSPCLDDEAGRRGRLVVNRQLHLGCPDVSGVSPGSVVVLRGHANRLPVGPLVNEAGVPARVVERPEEKVEGDATAVLIRGLVLRGVPRFAPSRIDGLAEYVLRLPASAHPDKQSDAAVWFVGFSICAFTGVKSKVKICSLGYIRG